MSRRAWFGLLLVTTACRTSLGPADAGGTDGRETPPVDAGRREGIDESACSLAAQDCGADAGRCVLVAVDGGGGLATACVLGQCDLVSQNCDAGQKCTYAQDDAGEYFRGCVDGAEAEEGAPCVLTPESDTCARGLICAQQDFADGGVGGRCARFCNRNTDCAGNDQCYVMLRFGGSNERPLTCGAELPGCDLLQQNCPAQGDGCYPGGDRAVCYPEGVLLTGARCHFSNDCVKGNLCVMLPSGNECRPLCSSPSGPHCKPVNLPDTGYVE